MTFIRPDFKFRDHIRDDLPQDDQPKKFILKRHRDCTSLEEVSLWVSDEVGSIEEVVRPWVSDDLRLNRHDHFSPIIQSFYVLITSKNLSLFLELIEPKAPLFAYGF